MKNKFTNIEYIRMYENYKDLCSNMISQVTKYKGWSDDTVRNEIGKLYNMIIEEFKGVNFEIFSIDELKQLGFREWDEDVILAPIWILECLEEGTKLTSIDGEEIVVGTKELDNDVRAGVTAYGFSKATLRDTKVEQVLED